MSTAGYAQAQRPLAADTPLGKDKLLLVGFSGSEAISRLFHFELKLLDPSKGEVAFDKLLGQPATVSVWLPNNKKRYFNGICNRVTQGHRDENFAA